jgi:tetratricopeptide (TPR) repeat protein
VRSYLAVNCVQCHQPGGASQGSWDARFTTKTDTANLINGLLVNNDGEAANRFIVPGDAAAWVGLGNALYRLGRTGEAARCYDRALAIDPADAATLVNRAWALVESGDRAGAARDVSAAAALGRAIDDELLEAVGRPGAVRPVRPSDGDAEEGHEAGGGPRGEE